MPNIENSNQYQTLTTSQKGRNVMPLLQPKSHFFLENNGFSQTEAQRFGAISDNEFQTTNTLSFSGSKNVYAICQGTVFLQPQAGNSNKVNLIIRPFRQPIPGVSIKYIVYRGLDKADFITTTGIIAGNETTGSGFVKYIWKEFKDFYEKIGITPPIFSSNFIGFPETAAQLEAQNETHLIDQYFYKITEVVDETGEENPAKKYEFPVIPRGLHLGKATGSIGIDIILNTGDYYKENDSNPFKLDLAYARAASYRLESTTITDVFLKKRYKENAVRFLDIAALYGLHANGAGKLYVAENTTPLTTKEDIFGMLNGFISKNKTYIYIQGNRQRSYNFYNKYVIASDNANNLKIGTTTDSLSETTFGTFTWPIHEFTTTVSDPPENSGFALQLTTDNHADAALYVQIGQIASEHEENFVRNKNLLQEPLANSQNTPFIKPLLIHVNAIENNIISSYVNIIYEGKQLFAEEQISPDTPDVVPQTHLIKDIDDVFGLLDAVAINTAPNNQQLPTIVDEKLQIINFPSTATASDIGVIKHQKIEDKLQTVNESTFVHRVTYETLVHDIKRVVSPYAKSGASQIDSAKTSMQTYPDDQNRFYQSKQPYRLEKKVFTDGSNTITGLLLNVTSGDVPVKKILGITQNEIQTLKSLVTDDSLINTKIYFKNLLENEEDTFISIENTNYKRYVLALIGESQTGQLHLYEPSNSIYVYTLDEFVFTSDEYARHIPELTLNVYTNFENIEE